jgi:RND family efflux transporter MFP subunit
MTRAESRTSRFLFPAMIVAVAAAGGWFLLTTGPKASSKEEARAPKKVKTIRPQTTDQAISVTAFGTVIPARRVTIEPEVSGIVVRLHPQIMPGGHVKAGDELYAIDPTLAELDLRQTEAEALRVEASLAEAERQWNESRQLAEDHVVPATELAALESAVRVQRAQLAGSQVRLDRDRELLARHVVTAPFNAIVVDESVDIGQRVGPGDTTVSLAGSDTARVRASLPTDRLEWIQFPDAEGQGANVRILLDRGKQGSTPFEGRVVQLERNLELTGRMARVLIEVPDPFGLKNSDQEQPLLLGSYVQVNIEAGVLKGVVKLDRAALRDGGRVWIVDANNELQIRDAVVRWSSGETVFIDPVLLPAESLIVSELRVALPGMKVQSEDSATTDVAASK